MNKVFGIEDILKAIIYHLENISAGKTLPKKFFRYLFSMVSSLAPTMAYQNN